MMCDVGVVRVNIVLMFHNGEDDNDDNHDIPNDNDYYCCS